MINELAEAPAAAKRTFLPKDLKVESFSSVEKYFIDIEKREIASAGDLKKWLNDRSELESMLSEELGWRYIKTNCNTQDKEASKAFEFFINEISPKIAPFTNRLNLKINNSPFAAQLNDHRFDNYLKGIKNDIKIFREENIPLIAKEESDEQKYGEVVAEMSVEYNGKTLTLPQAANLLKNPDRKLREEIYHKIATRRLKDKDKLNELFSSLLETRTSIANNAGYKNYRDYKFDELHRFDYTKEDCFRFHEAVVKVVVPVIEMIDSERKSAMKLDAYKPWDTEVDQTGKPDLKPFADSKQLIDKSIACFAEVNPFLGECMSTLHTMRHLDLESRVGKAPGGFNYPLYETGVPFIFMNATSSLRDLVTMMHEGGHAVHSILNHELDFVNFKELPSEVAEVASMSMELISMEHWGLFFENKEDLKRAKREQLEDVIGGLPWIACIDKYQHWLYEYPQQTVAERTDAWMNCHKQFGSKVIDWKGEEKARENLWQKQLHIYEVPFYYIEYGFAQLGAIAIWRNYRKDPEKTLQQYLNALKLGHTTSIPKFYETAGVKFDFSENNVAELISFLKEEL